MAKALTQIAIDNLKAGPARREVADGRTRGLFYILQPSGKASWALRYRIGGRSRKFTIGAYPDLGLATARKEAEKAIGDIAKGQDPAEEKKAA